MARGTSAIRALMGAVPCVRQEAPLTTNAKQGPGRIEPAVAVGKSVRPQTFAVQGHPAFHEYECNQIHSILKELLKKEQKRI
jgi:hypothetical protein